MSFDLNLEALAHLQLTGPAQVTVPAYARDDLTAGIVHFGVGNFHRAHQAVYLDELFSLGLSHDWAVIGAGVCPPDAAMWQKLRQQDWLTTIVQRDAEGQSARVTGAMIDFVEPGNGPKILAQLADPTIRIVSLTITEGGYFIDPASEKFNPGHPEIIRDAQQLQHMRTPETVFGLILAALVARRKAGIAPFTVMSCDNISGNGTVTADAVAGLAELFDPELAGWVRSQVAFPNSMVDRITPATTDRERRLVSGQFAINDHAPVACEPFRQWVVEDHFPTGRPRLEQVGVRFIADVAPYETMKIRILNGGHAAIAYPAQLLDIRFVHEAMHDPDIRGYLERLEKNEIIPTVPPIPGVDLGSYFSDIVHRFANPTVGDTITRLCYDGSNRQPKFILPTARDRLAQDLDFSGLALATAFWCRYCAGETESGAKIPPGDPQWARLHPLALAAKTDPAAFLAMDDIFGSLAKSPAYVHAFSKALATIWSKGTRKAIKQYLAEQT
ncbi:MAG: mannitol dehydrogenase family protein [Alphaproteobacteria bacterium]|nr:mannitol dehydrogenase family protein [Alphaproteobacteria bacterium]